MARSKVADCVMNRFGWNCMLAAWPDEWRRLNWDVTGGGAIELRPRCWPLRSVAVRLTRLATITLSRPAPPRVSPLTFRASNGIVVTICQVKGEQVATSGPVPATRIAWPYESTALRLAVEATTDAGPLVISDNLIDLPDDLRLDLEAAIVELADLLSVRHQCRRVVRSPIPCIAVSASEEGELTLIASAHGIRAPLRSRPRAVLLPEQWPDLALCSAVEDRADGVALLADALSEDGPVGQLHHFFRVFERAFRSGPGGCVDPLLAFLKTGPVDLGWTNGEVSDWFTRLRPEATHADRREIFARSADAEPFLGRLEYAAYDVVLNKRVWRARDSERRDVVALAAGLDDDRETLRLQRPDTTVVMPWVDPFGLFAIDFNFDVKVGPPAVSAMPGYTSDSPGVYKTRVQIQNDFEGTGEKYYYEVTTHHLRSSGEKAVGVKGGPTKRPTPRKQRRKKRR